MMLLPTAQVEASTLYLKWPARFVMTLVPSTFWL